MEKTQLQGVQPVKALATTVDEEDGRYLASMLDHDLSLKLTEGTLNDIAADYLSQVEILIPFIHPHIGRAEIDTMPRLRLIATRSTGYDHIDLAYATER